MNININTNKNKRIKKNPTLNPNYLNPNYLNPNYNLFLEEATKILHPYINYNQKSNYKFNWEPNNSLLLKNIINNYIYINNIDISYHFNVLNQG